MSEPEPTVKHVIDYRQAAESLYRFVRWTARNTVVESEIPDFASMSVEKAKAYCDAVGNSAVAISRASRQ